MFFCPEAFLENIESYKKIHSILTEIYWKNLIHRFASYKLLNFFYHSHLYSSLPNFCEFYHYFLPPFLPQLEKPWPYRPVPLNAIRSTFTANSIWILAPPPFKPPTFQMYWTENQIEGIMSFEHIIHFENAGTQLIAIIISMNIHVVAYFSLLQTTQKMISKLLESNYWLEILYIQI
jgi:hypothetical protein